MKMITWSRFMFNTLFRFLVGQVPHPYITNVSAGNDEPLPDAGLVRGTLIVGKPGSGKTVWEAMNIMEYALTHPTHPIFVLDASGSLTDDILTLVQRLPSATREGVDRRIVYDRLGDPQWVNTRPFFSDEYGLDDEEQVQRVRSLFMKMNMEAIERNPTMSQSIQETLPELCRLLMAIKNEHGECWQATESKRLLLDEGLLRLATNRFGGQAPSAKFYFERDFLGSEDDKVSKRERDIRTYLLRSILGVLEPRYVRACVGFYRPSWTPKEAIERGQIVIIDGSLVNNQESVQAILFSDVLGHILSQINKRRPHNPVDQPVMLVIDEVPMLLKVQGMAGDLAKISPQYRSRKLQVTIIIQGLWQLAGELRDGIWSFGNKVVFGIEDHNESYEFAKQLFPYNPSDVKEAAGREVSEPDRGQYLKEANWIQHLGWREMIVKRYLSEREEDKWVRYVPQTRDMPASPIHTPIIEYKEELLKRRAVPLRDALDVVNNRDLRPANARPAQV